MERKPRLSFLLLLAGLAATVTTQAQPLLDPGPGRLGLVAHIKSIDIDGHSFHPSKKK